MSNVLIGIIGVILFIGLALAGASFLGPRFQDATISSRATGMVQMTSQIAAAANMFELSEGRKVAIGNIRDTLFATGYLKSFQQGMRLMSAVGSAQEGAPAYAVVPVLSDVADPERLCREVNRRMVGTSMIQKEEDVPSFGRGCFVTERWLAQPGVHVVYQAI